MKKVLVTSIALGALVVGAGIAMAYTPGSGIKGTPHDLSLTGGTGTPGTYAADGTLDRVCVYCHAPHHALKASVTDLTYLPLWNHQPSGISAYQMYDAGPDAPDDINGHQSDSSMMLSSVTLPGSVSRLCLSCHDGSVGVNQYGFAPSGSQNQPPSIVTSFSATSSQFLIGGSGDLSNHHPIGFSYSAVQAADNELAAVTASIGANSIQDLLYGGNMECVTCHDVHNTENTGEKFLWVSDANSNFCCTCHLKCTP